jgi:hypothetical protein
MIKLKSFARGGWHLQVTAQELVTPDDKATWLSRRLDASDAPAQYQLIMHILYLWSDNDQFTPDVTLDMWHRVFSWLLQHQHYRWLLAARLLLQPEPTFDVERVSHLLFAEWTISIHQLYSWII